jgi:hypothetical protein
MNTRTRTPQVAPISRRLDVTLGQNARRRVAPVERLRSTTSSIVTGSAKSSISRTNCWASRSSWSVVLTVHPLQNAPKLCQGSLYSLLYC